MADPGDQTIEVHKSTHVCWQLWSHRRARNGACAQHRSENSFVSHVMFREISRICRTPRAWAHNSTPGSRSPTYPSYPEDGPDHAFVLGHRPRGLHNRVAMWHALYPTARGDCRSVVALFRTPVLGLLCGKGLEGVARAETSPSLTPTSLTMVKSQFEAGRHSASHTSRQPSGRC